MNRRFLFLGVAALAIVAFVGIAIWGGGHWGNTTQVTRVVPGQNGETLVITEGGRRGFFPFFPFFPFIFFIPLIWFFVIGGIFSMGGRRRWGSGGFGPSPEDREAWLADWHRRQHSQPVPTDASSPTETPPPPAANS